MNFLKQIWIKHPHLYRSYYLSSFNCYKSNSVDLAYNSYENTATSNEVPPVIIMHGLFGSKQNWKSKCKALHSKSRPSRKIIALDARNHGESPHTPAHSYIDLAEDIRHYCEQNNIQKSIVIGHSMGGRAMMCLALKYPELVDRAIIVDISPVRSSPSLFIMGEIFSAMTKVEIPDSLKMSEGRELANQQLMGAIPSKETRDFILMNLVKGGDGSMDDLPEIKKIFPNSNLKFIDSGHLVHVEQPYEFLDLALKFINN